MKLFILFTGLLIWSGDNVTNEKVEMIQLMNKVQAAYQHTNLQLTYHLKTYLKQTVIQESTGQLLKRGNQFYKEMDLVAMVTNGKYAITIDRRIMTIFYHEKVEQPIVQDIMPDINNIDLEVISKSGRQTLVRNRLLNAELDSTDYYVNNKTGMLELVRHYKTYEGGFYRTDINYNNLKANETPSAAHFDLSQWVDGKGKKARLNEKGNNEGFTFVNTLKKSKI